MTETNVPASGAEPEVGAEVPEADAVEQAQGGDVVTPANLRSIPDDVPEADALEQAYEVDMADDY